MEAPGTGCVVLTDRRRHPAPFSFSSRQSASTRHTTCTNDPKRSVCRCYWQPSTFS